MWSGPAALNNIDRTLQSVRNEVVRLDAELASLTERLTGQERRRVQIFRDIAAVRLVEIEQGRLDQELGNADQQAAATLARREQALNELNQSLDSLSDNLEQLEVAREAMLQEVNSVSERVVNKESEVQQSLSTDSRYLEQLEVTRNLESVAAEAAEKVADAQTDMATKAQPYQKDDLFMYLWNRGFGTTEYKAGLVARALDGWVARVINYAPARINYWNLTEIPKRLQDHADAVAGDADEAIMALQQLELDALAAAGVPELEQTLEDLRAKIDQQDDQLEDKEEELNKMLATRATFIAGEDSYIEECLTTLGNALQQKDLRSIHRYVQVTHSPTDDELVTELQDLASHSQSLKADLSDVRGLHNKQLSRLKEIEEVRRNFKNSRFDDVRSGFSNESLLASILAQFVQGVVSGSDVWRVIKRSQRYRDVGSLPDFGSGGFGNIGDILGGGQIRPKRRQRRSSWHWPKPRRGGGGFNFPRSGGSSSGGGGFRTGGGF